MSERARGLTNCVAQVPFRREVIDRINETVKEPHAARDRLIPETKSITNPSACLVR